MRKKANRTTTSPWKLNRKAMTLELDSGPIDFYEIDLQRITSSAAMLDWIMQVASKRWADDRTLAWLVRDLNRILRPQQNLCGGGQERGPIDARAIIQPK